MRVNMTSWETTRNAKYLAIKRRSRYDRVTAPMYFDSLRMMMGKKNPNRPETAGGRTPEAIANEIGDIFDHVSMKGTYAVS
jgi:hypothetical protein